MTSIPRLYVILDGDSVRAEGLTLVECARALHAAKVSLVQYRDKSASRSEILAAAATIRSVFEGSGATLILNDSPELAREAEWDGVHVGQGDPAVAEARRILGPGRVVGISTHTAEQFRAASATDADYIAFGPVFRTVTKVDAEPVVGLEGVRQVRGMDARPLVAIGGISNERIRSVIEAGADAVAVIGALFERGRSVEENAVRLLATAANAAR